MKINYLSEFRLIERSSDYGGLVPFRYTYYTPKSVGYVVSYDGQEYTNCRCETSGELLVIFENHLLNVGELCVKREYFLSDSDFADGVCNIVSVESTDIELTVGRSEETELSVEVIGAYVGSVASQTPVCHDFDSTTTPMQPNTYYYHTPAPTTIVIDMAPSSAPVLCQYMLYVELGESVPIIDYPDDMVWVGCVGADGVPLLVASRSYEINIVDGRGLIVEW